MRSPLAQIYSELMLGNTVRVPVESLEQFNTLRTSLHRHNRLVRQIDDNGFSLQANYNGSEALFRLGPDRRIKHKYTFTIENNDAQISGTLE
jgi:hypothetical protein